MKDTKREPYKTKGYNQDIRMEKLKQTLKKKKNFLAVVGGTCQQWQA
jgi:hypothetical protein